MGVKGAAVATLVSRILEAAVSVIYVFAIDQKLRLKFSDLLKTDRQLLKDFIRYGPVSYTHLDVYKRQACSPARRSWGTIP